MVESFACILNNGHLPHLRIGLVGDGRGRRAAGRPLRVLATLETSRGGVGVAPFGGGGSPLPLQKQGATNSGDATCELAENPTFRLRYTQSPTF